MDWAVEKANRTKTKSYNPAAIGAVINPGRCLNLLDGDIINLVRENYEQFCEISSKATLPKNKTVGDSSDLLLRNLDCAVIEFLHHVRRSQGEPQFDTVRGVFVEGKPIYENSGFHEKSHIQICVRNPQCLKGFFRILEEPSDDLLSGLIPRPA